MLVRQINFSIWKEAFYYLKENGLKETVVDEKYIFKEQTENNEFTISEEDVVNVWFYAILTLDSKPFMVTCLLDPEFAWKNPKETLSYVQDNPQLWLERKEIILPMQPIPRPRILNDWLERAALEQVHAAPDAVSLSGL